MTKLVGILNLTPDSFSDGGAYGTPGAAVAATDRLWDEGADILDIGAESTRPGASALSAAQEWARLERIVPNIPPRGIYSIDTRHAETARKALAYGVAWINDVSGFADPAMVEAVKKSDCKLVFMHSLTIPADKNIVLPQSCDVAETLLAFARERLKTLETSGIARDRLIFDPGIGFGKTAAQSWEIIENIAAFKTLGIPLLVGHSRKSFLGDKTTLDVSRILIGEGVDYLRVHEVAAHRRLLHG